MEEVEQAVIAGVRQAQAPHGLVTAKQIRSRQKPARTTTNQRKVVVREQAGRRGWRARQKAVQRTHPRPGRERQTIGLDMFRYYIWYRI